MYFSKNLTQADAKSLFRKLSLELHPDKKGGDAKKFIAMQAEYEQFLKGNFSFTGEQAKAETTSMDEFIKANEFIKNWSGVKVELTGVWLWLSGNTMEHKEDIKEKGFRWSRSKKKWYKAPYKITGRKKGTNFNKIKATYGYQSATIKGATAIA